MNFSRSFSLVVGSLVIDATLNLVFDRVTALPQKIKPARCSRRMIDLAQTLLSIGTFERRMQMAPHRGI